MEYLIYDHPLKAGKLKRRTRISSKKRKALGGMPGKDDQWHPYRLQSLQGSKFVRIVNQILQGQASLLSITQMVN